MDDVIAAERLSTLIGLIYDCAIDPARWPIALEAIRVELSFANASLDLMTVPDAVSLLNIMTNIPAPYADRLLHYAPHVADMWGGVATIQALPMHEPAVLSRVVGTPRDSWTNPLFLEWARPQGIDDVLAIWLARDDGAVGVIGMGRFAKDGPIGERELAVARLLVPHLQRVAVINRLLDAQAFERSMFAALIDTLRLPVFLVARDLRLAHVNRAGRMLLDGPAALQERRGYLVARDSGTAGALAAAVVQASDDRAGMARKGLGIPLRRADGAIGALHVLPLGEEENRGRHDPLTAVFVAESHAPLVAPGDVFASLFGLTPGERKVFDQVVAGRSVAQVGDMLGIGHSTVKTHLLRIYDKTGVRRQAELVHIAASLSSPVG